MNTGSRFQVLDHDAQNHEGQRNLVGDRVVKEQEPGPSTVAMGAKSHGRGAQVHEGDSKVDQRKLQGKNSSDKKAVSTRGNATRNTGNNGIVI